MKPSKKQKKQLKKKPIKNKKNKQSEVAKKSIGNKLQERIESLNIKI